MPISTNYLLIGAGLASSQAAKQLREKDPDSPIMLVGDEPHVPYDRPPLSKEFLRGEKPQAQLLFDPEQYFLDHRISLKLGRAVQRLDSRAKTATLATGETITFEKALIATGGRPVLLTAARNVPRVHYLRTIEDAAAIAAHAAPGTRAVIIGAGFIGLEVAASLTQRGVQVTVVEVGSHIWPRFTDATLAGYFQSYCAQKGIVFHTNDTVVDLRPQQSGSSVITRSGKTLPCDFACVGVGIVPNAELAVEAGLLVENGVVVNEYLQTSHPDIYAAGDVASYPDPYSGKRRRVEHWGHAEYCGQIAGQNMAGALVPYDLLTYVWSDIFDLHLEFAGDESEHDQILIRGRFEDKSFIVLYLKNHRLRAYFAINTKAKEFPALQRLIKQRTDLSGKDTQLQDPAVPLKSLG